MNTIISFTPAALIGGLLAVCAGIVTISAAVNALIGAAKKATQPQKDENERVNLRLDKAERRLDRHDELFLNDKRAIEGLENGTRVTQKALLALLDHSIDGNNTAQMKQAKDELQRFLIERQ